MSAALNTIRVFISSTFRDMEAEREELIKQIFPQLRKLCEDRGVGFVDVDLRWGVTEEQTERGEVLPICLAEIDRCRPYFIGLLAERYGWVPPPDAIPQELITDQSWLAEHHEKSVTELEIVHGVLRNPAMAGRAHFYFRDPAYLDQIPPNKRADFVETDPAARDKLAALKTDIRESGVAWKSYTDPRALGQAVLRDLTAVIDREFPSEKAPDALERETLEHEAFAQSRMAVYIGRQECFDRLDEHAGGREDGPGLVLLGESGSGKSALLANWATRHRERHLDDLVLLHFIGANPYSADWTVMLRRVLEELKRRFQIEQEVPDEPEALRPAFANWLHMAAARGRVVLVLDALNQLEDKDGAPDLVWLPAVMPGNVRLIVSTLPGRPLEELYQRGWPTLVVEPFEEGERRQFIEKYLAQYAKSLSAGQIERIASAPAAANPLYLRALLEELRVFGSYEWLDRRIEHYLAAPTVDGLYERILERYEQDYERDRPNLVRDAMTLVWAARRGLSEGELLDLLGTEGQALPRAHWSPLHLASERSLVSRSGLLDFFHDYLRQAVENRYLSTVEKQRAVHLRLGDYFDRQQGLSARKIDELPWQLSEAGTWQRLYDLLADLSFFAAAWNASEFEVKAHWARLERDSEFRMVDAYRSLLDDPAGPEARSVWYVSYLLADTGHLAEALPLREHLGEHYREAGDQANLQAALTDQANIHHDRGDLDSAMVLYKEQERICRELEDKDGLQGSLGNQAVILETRGDPDGAMAFYKEQERICRELGNKDSLAIALGNQGTIHYDRGDLDSAMALRKEEERICREMGNKQGLSISLGNQAPIHHIRGDLDGAMALHKEEERICRELGNKSVLQISLGNQAVILKTRGDLDGAMALRKEQERICRELGNKDGLQRSLGGQALILRARGDLDGAMALHKEQERICRELGNKHGLQVSLGNQANIHHTRGDLDGAMALRKEEERICRELGNKDGLRVSLGGQAMILKSRSDLNGAIAMHKEEERICRELGNKDGLACSLANQAGIHYLRGDMDTAMVLYKEQERICHELGMKYGLEASLGGQALILHARGDLDGAMALHKEEERICREMENKDGLQASLGNQANIHYARRDLDGAMALYKDQERICRELGKKDGLARSLINQAELLSEKLNRPLGALQLAEDSYRLATEHGLVALAEQIKPILHAIRAKTEGLGKRHAATSRLANAWAGVRARIMSRIGYRDER